ncbi:MAG: aspartate aminotransferase family protein, partial [Anaerovorax sp.]
MSEKTKQSFSKTEGDVNLTKERILWQEKYLSQRSKERLEEDGKYFIHQALSTPCLNAIKGVEGIYIIDEDDRRYMDFHGNSVHQLGYNHPKLIKALQDQLEELSFSPRRYANKTATALAKKLCTLMPSQDYRVLFTTGGTSSIGVALKIVRKATGRFKIISLWDSFHGASLDAISVGGEGHFRSNIGPLLPGCEHVMPFNSYRCTFGSCQDCGLKCIDYIEYVCKCEGDIGAILMEPIRCTDVQIPPVEYYVRLRKICDDYNIALIFDEVPTAFGRTGKMFAFENYPIEPDLLVIGKGLGGSLYPISAVLAKEKFNVCQEISLGHYTHEKSPLGSAVALALIDTIESE